MTTSYRDYARAEAYGRSPEEEHRAILEQVLRQDGESFWEKARRLRMETSGRRHTDAATIIRADRDRDYPAG